MGFQVGMHHGIWQEDVGSLLLLDDVVRQPLSVVTMAVVQGSSCGGKLKGFLQTVQHLSRIWDL